MDVTLKCARFLKISILALNQERTILIISKVQYTECIGSRQANLKQISRVSHLSGKPFSFLIIVSLKLVSQIIYMLIRVTMSNHSYECKH